METYAWSLAGSGKEKVAAVINGRYEKVKDIKFIEKRALSRGATITPFVGKSNSYTDTINKMIKIAEEDLPGIENGLTLLNTKLETINNIVKEHND